ncbi:crAss001_48 related protein [Aeromonas enteropelogenes]|uniref:crAss001_48 related protein n=1 Tax=Aeromonas enteropelogenes TaxID=29489 RepID=UPI002285EC42|nr:hypothetical protein [Aeromonas enteropelogenes]MCZ0752577.1 hypothetical protein [Aeromonas enteropelogenes]
MTVVVEQIQERISDELAQLRHRIAGLEGQINHSELFNCLCVPYQNLMKRQLVAMREYAEVLEARLAAVEEFRSA